jgi:hypothetical protein
MSEPILLEAKFRSSLERKVAKQLDGEGIEYDFEGHWVHYTVPARKAKYLPDFPIRKTTIILETKGRFGGTFRGADGAQERQKLILLKEQHPEYDIRIVFERAANKIYKGSKTTYAKWADDHGFKWSDKGVVPPEWIAEIKAQQRTTRKSK